MYVPEHFRLPPDRLSELLQQVRPGNLVTVHDDGPKATFVPFYYEERDGKRWLVTHLVRNNPQVRTPTTGPALAIMDVMDAYVSPHWYATNAELANVPTWDYVTIHATGRVHVRLSPRAALQAAGELTLRLEGGGILDAVTEAKLERMSRAIVGVEIEIEQIEAKAKMSQNRHPRDLRSLIAHFESLGQTDVADYLREVSLPRAQERFTTLARLSHGSSSSRSGVRQNHTGPCFESAD